VFGAGETLQIRTQKELDQSLIIDTGELDTLDFDPDKEVLREAISRAAEEVMFYFYGGRVKAKPTKRYPPEKA
jgi:hypothetical protein